MMNGMEYRFDVRAYTANARGQAAGIAVRLPPARPGQLTATADVTEVTLRWADPEDGSVTGYQVQWGEEGVGLPDWSGAAVVEIGAVTTHAVGGLAVGTSYVFEVRARAGGVYGRASVVTAQTTAPVPADLAATVEGGNVALTWEAPPAEEDNRENSDTEEFTITVVCAPFVIREIDKVEVPKDTNIALTASVNPACPTVEFTISGQPTDVGIVSDTGFIHGDVGSVAEYDGTVTARDGMKTTTADEEDFILQVIDPCDPVSISYENVTVAAGAAISLTPTVSGECVPIEYTKRGNWPSWVTLDANSGRVGGTAPSSAAGESYPLEVRAMDRKDNIDDGRFTVTVSCPTLTLDPIADADVAVNESFTRTATARGGCDPITITMTGAPSGVTMPSGTGRSKTISSSNGISSPGTHTVTVTARDEQGTTATRVFTVTVSCPTLTLDPIADADVAVNESFTRTATARGGCDPITITMTGAPSGVTMPSGTGRSKTISSSNGISSPGTHTVTVTARDSRENSVERDFTIRVSCPPLSVASISDVAASKGEPIGSIHVRATGGCPPYSYRLSPTASTAGLSISSDGEINGSPRAVGSWQITVSVTDAGSNTSRRSFWIRVAEPIFIGPINDMYGELNASFSEGPVEVWGGAPPYRYALSGQPSGLRVTNTGAIEGTPSESGDFDVTLTVRDQHGRSASSLFFIMISSGDFNRDGRADAADAELFNRKMGLRESDSGYDRRMDMNGDGIINWADMVILTRHIERDASSGGGSGSDTSGD